MGDVYEHAIILGYLDWLILVFLEHVYPGNVDIDVFLSRASTKIKSRIDFLREDA